MRLIGLMLVLACGSNAATAQASRPLRCATSHPSTQPMSGEANPSAEGFDLANSDAKAIELADETMLAMGGRKAWDETRYIAWTFFGSRHHLWDKHNGMIRVQGRDQQRGKSYVVIMNLHTRDGRVWLDGDEIGNDDMLKQEMLVIAERAWINDSYWLAMPYKLRDTGVTLNYVGEQRLPDSRMADVIQLSFDSVGTTPQNKYNVYIARDTKLVEQWQFFRRAEDGEPQLTTPWKSWKKYGRIMLSSDRGTRGETKPELANIAVYDKVPADVFEDSNVALPNLPESSTEE